ncbi:MAG TPA: phosphotransferase [Actinomycetales bacterium]|nr:phosphotransferase [Actinomycetales bacterium]
MSSRDDLGLLTGPDATDLLGSALATAGGELLDWSVRQVDHRPGSGTTVAYRVRVRWADREQVETLAATTAITHEPTPGVLTLADGDLQVSVWRFPVDPALPGLGAACDRRVIARLLTSFGLPGVDADGTTVRLRTRAYRPGRRAVIEATCPGGRLFVKVVRPQWVEDLHRRHSVLYAAGLPVPRSLGWTEDGLLVLQALRGSSLRAQLRAGGAAPSGEELVQMLGRLPDEVLELPHRRSWTDNVSHYAKVIGATLPVEAARATQLAAQVRSAVAGIPPDEPTHGDLYEAQLLVSGAAITGLLDVDTAGPGRRADDLACAIAHLHVLADIDAQEPGVPAPYLTAVAGQWQEAAERAVDRVELRNRVAGVLMSLATGPHRVQEPGWEAATSRRLDLVEQWAESATAR